MERNEIAVCLTLTFLHVAGWYVVHMYAGQYTALFGVLWLAAAWKTHDLFKRWRWYEAIVENGFSTETLAKHTEVVRQNENDLGYCISVYAVWPVFLAYLVKEYRENKLAANNAEGETT